MKNSTGLCIVASLTAAFKLLQKRKNNKTSEVAKKLNPWGLPGFLPSDPELGNLGDMGAAGGIGPFGTKYHQEFGPLFTFYWGKELVVSVGTNSTIPALMQHNDRPFFFFAAFEELIGAKSVQYMNGEVWKQRRLTADPVYSHRAVSKREMDLAIGSDYVFADLREKLAKSKSNTVDLMVKDASFEMAVNTFATFSFGNYFKDRKETEKLLRCYEDAFKIMCRKALQGEILSAELEATLKNGIEQFHQLAKNAIAHRKAEVAAAAGDGGIETTFLDSLSASQEEDVLFADFITYIIAGFHTSGNFIIWLIYHLAKNPEYQVRIREELLGAAKADAAAVGSTEVLHGEELSLDIAMKSVTLDMLVNEVLRFEALGSFVGRSNEKGPVTVNGVTFPTGTNFVLAITAAGLNPEDYPEPTKFNPERFRPQREGQVRTNYSLPFGLGKRRCPGHHYALAQGKLVVARLVATYAITMDAQYHDEAAFQRDLAFVPTPKEDFPVHLERL